MTDDQATQALAICHSGQESQSQGNVGKRVGTDWKGP